jgi:hypothetical protein
MGTSKIFTAVIPTGYSTNIIGTSYGVEYGQHIGRKNRSKMSIIWRSIQRKNKIDRIYEKCN